MSIELARTNQFAIEQKVIFASCLFQEEVSQC